MTAGKKLNCFLTLCCAVLLSAGTGCSYVADYIEGSITNRASFSITVEPTETAHTYNIDWSSAGDVSDEDFAGYEIYVTEEADDEFSGYTVIAACYSLSDEMVVDSYLSDEETREMDIDLTDICQSGRIYYFRVAVITWGSNEEDRSENWTTENGYEENWSAGGSEYFYNKKSSLSEISGGCPIVFQ
ncbi:MAG: hypothetical protein ACRCUT_11565 [Spirochaetota bacterium]